MSLEKSRRSTAAQYFMEDEEDDRNPKSNQQKVSYSGCVIFILIKSALSPKQ